MFEVFAPVHAPVEVIRAYLDGPGLEGELAIGGTLVRGPGMIGAQGGWWYRGEYTAERRGSTGVLVHRVYNVAARGARWVPLANRFFLGYRQRLQHSIDELAARIDARPG